MVIKLHDNIGLVSTNEVLGNRVTGILKILFYFFERYFITR